MGGMESPVATLTSGVISRPIRYFNLTAIVIHNVLLLSIFGVDAIQKTKLSLWILPTPGEIWAPSWARLINQNVTAPKRPMRGDSLYGWWYTPLPTKLDESWCVVDHLVLDLDYNLISWKMSLHVSIGPWKKLIQPWNLSRLPPINDHPSMLCPKTWTEVRGIKINSLHWKYCVTPLILCTAEHSRNHFTPFYYIMEIGCPGTRSTSTKNSPLASGRGGLARRIRRAHCYFAPVGLLCFILVPTLCSQVASSL